MKIWIAQINTKVWDLEYNEKRITDTIEKLWKDSDVIVFPEMTTTGYPPNGLLEDNQFVKDQKGIVYRARELIQKINKDLVVILGCVDYDTTAYHPSGKMVKYNSAAVVSEDIKIYHKALLPNYDVFFEQRYFTPGTKSLCFKIAQEITGTVTICEDIWDEAYKAKPIQKLGNKQIDTIFNISSSPFVVWKLNKRLELLKRHQSKNPMNYVYVNQVGGQDELVFDGGSMILDKDWKLIYFGKTFEEDIQIIDTEKKFIDKSPKLESECKDKYRNILKATTLWLKDYLEKTGIQNVVIWISGGIDSAISAYLARQVLPADKIHTLYMPTKHSKSLDDAKQLAANLWLDMKVWEINNILQAFEDYQNKLYKSNLDGLAYENTQARIRANILMMMANQSKINGILINNSNKTELALWYGTYGWDLLGGLNLIWDMNKKEVFEFAKWINQMEWRDIIPNNIINKPPTAELQDEQVDPFDYDLISEPVDELLFGANPEVIAKKYNIDIQEILRLAKLIKINEFKRKQWPPIIKLKDRSIGIWRVWPIVR